uniref:Reverse transcriptase domain-containing protein n=1 Tax=Heliothis virescens TaxID=7102 RepID=A0A2A4K1K2_HELVI
MKLLKDSSPPKTKTIAKSLPETDTLRNVTQKEIGKTDVFEGGRLSHFVRVWKREGAPLNILQTITGYVIPFVKKPPRIPFHPKIISRFETKKLNSEIQTLIQQKVLEISTVQTGFLSTMFPVPKPDNKVRPIINLKGLNKFLTPKKFRLLNHFKVPHFLQKKDFLIKIDISQAYFHIPVANRHRRFLSIVYQKKVFQFTCLPFGLSTAPLTFARVSNWIASRLRQMNIRVIVYLDDFLIANQDPIKLQKDAFKTVQFLQKLGWIINMDKSLQVPSQRIEYLGIEWDTFHNTKALPKKKISSLRRDLNKLLSSQRWSWQSAKSLLGKLNFASFVIPLGKLHSRKIQRAANLLPEKSARKKFPIPAKAFEECKWWMQNLEKKDPLFKSSETIFITSDASDQGWGAQINEKHISGVWDINQSQWHINKKELFAVLLAVQSEKDSIKNKRVVVQSDNRTVIAYIKNQGGTRSSQLTGLVYQLLTLTKKLHAEICPQYIPGIYNDVADSLSRQRSLSDWHLSMKVCNQIFQKWGVPEVDLFASKDSKVVPAYVSRDAKDKDALFIDAFSKRWEYRLAWIFPPPSLIPRVLAHLNQAKGSYILIVPRWNRVFWRSDLRSRAIDRPFQIRNLHHHLKDLTPQTNLTRIQHLRLEAWKVRGGQF